MSRLQRATNLLDDLGEVFRAHRKAGAWPELLQTVRAYPVAYAALVEAKHPEILQLLSYEQEDGPLDPNADYSGPCVGLTMREGQQLEKFFDVLAAWQRSADQPATEADASPAKRYVQHAKKPDWGVGYVVSEHANKLEIEFEHAGRKVLSKQFAHLQAVDTAEVSTAAELAQRVAIAEAAAKANSQRSLSLLVEVDTAMLVRLLGYTLRKSLDQAYPDRENISEFESEGKRHTSTKISRLAHDMALLTGIDPKAPNRVKLGSLREHYAELRWRDVLLALCERMLEDRECDLAKLRLVLDTGEADALLNLMADESEGDRPCAECRSAWQHIQETG